MMGLRADAENASVLGNNAQNAKMGVTRTTRLRATLGDVANKQNLGRANQDGRPLKPGRAAGGLSRQKGTAQLAPAAHAARRTQPARKASAEALINLQQQQVRRRSKEEEQPMELANTSADNEELMDLDPVTTEAVAESWPLEPVEDIDLEDAGNPQMAPEYVNDIYAYMRMLERHLGVQEDYLSKTPTACSIKPRMRNMLVDWLVEVQEQFSLLQETLYLTVSFVDRFLQVRAQSVTTKQLQLVGVTAMFLAAKYEEMYPPEIGDFAYITDHAYSASQIRKMEIEMVRGLNFDMGKPLPINFLRRNSKAGQVDANTHSLAKYALELTLVDYQFSHVEPSRAAAAALAFAMKLLDRHGRPMRQLWTPTLAHYSAYSLDALHEPLRLLADLAHKTTLALDSPDSCNNGSTKRKLLCAVGRKYKNKKFMKVSLINELRGEVILRIAKRGADA